MIKRHVATFILATLLFTHALAALVTVNPTSNQTPDPGQGGAAVTGNTNTGHTSTTTTQVGAGANTKSCKWTAFPTVAGSKISVTLKLSWTEDGSIGDIGSNTFRIQYSIDGGTGWTDIINHTDVIAPGSGSSSVTLPVSQDLTLVQVRDRLVASATSGTTTVTGSVSTIRLEVVTQDAQVIVMMDE